MPKTLKDRLLERLPGSRITSDEGRSASASASFPEKVKTFLKEFKTEMKKVTWPSRKETAASTMVVIVTVLIIVVFLAFVDNILGWIVHAILSN